MFERVKLPICCVKFLIYVTFCYSILINNYDNNDDSDDDADDMDPDSSHEKLSYSSQLMFRWPSWAQIREHSR